MSREPYEVWRARKISEEMGATYEAPMYDWREGLKPDDAVLRAVVSRIIKRSTAARARTETAGAG